MELKRYRILAHLTGGGKPLDGSPPSLGTAGLSTPTAGTAWGTSGRAADPGFVTSPLGG